MIEKKKRLHIVFDRQLSVPEENKLINFFQASIKTAAKRLRNFEHEIKKLPIPKNATMLLELMSQRAKAQAENIDKFFLLEKETNSHYIFSFPDEEMALAQLHKYKLTIPRPETFGLKEAIPKVFANEFKMERNSVKTYFEEKK